MLQVSFTQLIEHVQHLSHDEKQQLQCWLENDLREVRRDEIYAAYQESQAKLGELEFSSDLNVLKRKLEI